MAEYALFKPTSSDEESEELNCIYEKLRRRRQPAIRKPQQADDSSMSSSDDTSMSPNSKGGDDFSTSLSDESGQQQLNSRHWKVAQTTCRTTTPSTRSMRDLKHPSSAKTVGANDLFPSVDNTVSHSDAVCKPTAAPSYALDEDTFDADLAALEVPPAKASCRDSIDSLRPLNAESHRFDEEESFPDITEAELAAIDINEIQQTALCIHVRSAPSPSPPPDVVDDASIHKQVQRDPEVSPLTKRKNDNQSSPTIRPTVVHDNFLRLQQAHRVEATTCLNLNQTKVFSKTSLDSAVYDDSIDEASLAVIDITVKESVPINERKSSTDDDHYKTLDKQDPATADRPAVNAMDQEIFADDTFANLNEATIAAIEDIDGKNQRDQNPVGLQGRVWLTKSATAHKKPCPDTFNKNSIVTNATTSNPYQISRRPPQSKEKTCRSAMPNEDLAFTVETSSTPVAQASGAAHCCVYEYQPVGEDWIFEEGDHRKHAESFFTEADLNVRNVDAFGFEIEATPDQAAGGQEASQHRGILKRSIVSSTKGEDFEFDLKEPYRHTFQETKDSIRAKYSDRAQHLCDDRSSENVNFDEAFGFDEQMIPTRRDVHKADEDVHERTSEIDPTLCAPMPCDITQEPIVHHFTARNRPVNSRRLIPVAEVFESPVKEMWKTKFETFNQLQSEIANMLAYSDDNVVVSAPTGAGKTAIFEMAIARFVALDLRAAIPGQGTKPQISKRRKIVYVSPSKALCEERFEDWSKRLSEMNLGIEIVVVTGDGDPSESFHDLASAHFILTTPEKWDSLTRRWTDNFFLMASVKLFLVDEVHLIADESRGCCLEAIVCRMKTIQSAASRVEVTQTVISQSSYVSTSPEAVNSLLRFVAVSATLPNITDIATFFEANEAHTFDESYRPVPLTTHVIGQGKLGEGSNGQFHFWRNLDRNVPEIIIRFSNRRPTIVFCHSKADCERLADLLAIASNIGHRDGSTSAMASQTRVSKLQRVLLHGIGYHHAGLEVDDRRLVERSFISGKIRVLCATSTLAMGVNLPAHLVVIKGTMAWRGGSNGYKDLDRASLLQMIGRAGRPGFDSSGTAVIMTDNDSKSKFEKLASSGLSLARSNLTGDKLVETINTEVSQRVITSCDSAINWIKGTLFFIQLAKNPGDYGVKVVSPHSIDTHLLKVCKNTMQRLHAIGALDLADGQEIFPNAAGHIMSQRLVDYGAMEQITKLPFDASQCQMLKLLASFEGLQRPVRRSEKKELNEAHKNLKLYKLDGPLSKARVQEPWEKAFVLLQAYVEEVKLKQNDYALRQEMYSMVDYATRMLAAIEEYAVKGSKHGIVVAQSLKIRRSFALNLWTADDGILRQIKGIGKTLTSSLRLNGISTFDDVMKKTDTQLEEAADRPPPFGADLRKASARILRCRLKISATIETANGSTAPNSIICSLKRSNGSEAFDYTSNDSHRHGNAPEVTYTLVAHTDRPGGLVLFKENIPCPGTHEALLPLKFGKITVRLIASIVGLDDTLEIKGNDVMAQSSRRTSRSRATIGVSEKRIRDANQTKGEALASQFRPHVRGIEDPRASRGKNKLTGASRNPRLAASVPQSHPTKSSDKASVTPSPKLTLPAIFSRIIAPKLSEVQQSKLYSTSTLTTCHHESQQLPYRSTHAAPLSLIQLTWDEAVPAPLRIQGPAHPPPAHTMGQEVHPAFRSIPTREGSLKRSPQRSNSDYDARFSNSNVSAWNRSKRHQSKSQERAFVHKKDNPFSLYKHDPNDTESYLDRLSSQNKESIIPPEGLKALADASKAQLYSVPVGAVRGNVYRPPHQRGKRDSLGAALSTQELLSQKAAEHNAHMSVVTCAPAFNYDQSRYSQLGNTFDQALHGSAIFYRTMGVQPNNYDSNEVASWASRECNSDFTQNKEHFIRERAPDNFHQNRDELRQYTYEKNGYGYSCAPQPIPVVQGGFHSDFQGAHQPTDLEEKNGSEQPWQPGFTSALYSSEHGFQTVSGRNSRMGYRTDQYQGMNEEDIETAFF